MQKQYGHPRFLTSGHIDESRVLRVQHWFIFSMYLRPASALMVMHKMDIYLKSNNVNFII